MARWSIHAKGGKGTEGVGNRTRRRRLRSRRSGAQAGIANREGEGCLGRRKKTGGTFGINLPVLERKCKYMTEKIPGKALNVLRML